LHLFERHAALGQRAGTHRLDDDVGTLHQIEIDLDTLRLAEVEGDRFLAPVDVERQQRVLAATVARLDDRPGHLAAVIALRRLDFDHVGAEVGQQAPQFGGAQHRALDHPHASQQSLARHRLGSPVSASGGHPPASSIGRRRYRTPPMRVLLVIERLYGARSPTEQGHRAHFPRK
jgi:hypothetical protein